MTEAEILEDLKRRLMAVLGIDRLALHSPAQAATMNEDPQVTIRKIDMAWELARATAGQQRGLPEWSYIGAMLRVFKSAYVQVSKSLSELNIPPNVCPQDGHGPVHALQQLIGGDGVDFDLEVARFLEKLGKQFAEVAVTLAIEIRRGDYERPSLKDGQEQHHA